MILMKASVALVMIAFAISYLYGYEELQGHRRRRRPKIIRACAFAMLGGIALAFIALAYEVYKAVI